jgi:serine/threonine protein kinase
VLNIGQSVLQYRIVRLISADGCWDIYEAEDLNLGRHVALIKLDELDGNFPTDERLMGRMRKKFALVLQLGHPNICRADSIFTDNGKVFIVAELLKGTNLDYEIAGAPLPLAQAVEWAKQIASALDAAHSASLLHLDIKPSNIFVTSSGIKLMNLGLATLVQAAVDFLRDGHMANTLVMGGLAEDGSGVQIRVYLSPEQVRGHDCDARSDIFSFGALLYEMVTGVPAFTGNTPYDRLNAVLNFEPAPASSRNPRVPPSLEAIIRRALEKNREDRFQSATEMLAALERVDLSGLPDIPAPHRDDDADREAPHQVPRDWSAPSSGFSAELPPKIADYHIRRELARGGFGIVCEAETTPISSDTPKVKVSHVVAIKFVPEIESSPATAALDREARVLASLRDPHIVKFIDSGVGQGYRYLVTELLYGSALNKCIAEHPGRFNIVKKLRIMQALAQALDSVHNAGFVHCDIKPENLILEKDESHLVLIDFGSAVETGQTPSRVIGTPAYMAPEQFRGEPVSFATDLFAFGNILFEIIAGNPPFRPDNFNLEQTMFKVLQDPIPSLREILGAPPPEAEGTVIRLDRLFARLLAKDPSERPESAAKIVNDLERIVDRITPFASTWFNQRYFDLFVPPEKHPTLIGDYPLASRQSTQVGSGPPAPPQTTLVGGRPSATPRTTQVGGGPPAPPQSTLVGKQSSPPPGLTRSISVPPGSVPPAFASPPRPPAAGGGGGFPATLAAASGFVPPAAASAASSAPAPASASPSAHPGAAAGSFTDLIRASAAGSPRAAFANPPAPPSAVPPPPSLRSYASSDADTTEVVDRALDLAMNSHVQVDAPAELIALLRLPSSRTLAEILKDDPDSEDLSDRVRTRPVGIEFARRAGTLQPIEVTMRVEAPSFDPPRIERKIRIHPERDAERQSFVLTPRKPGTARVQFELLAEDLTIASQTLKVETDPAGAPIVTPERMIISVPIAVTVTRSRRRLFVVAGIAAALLLAVAIPVFLHKPSTPPQPFQLSEPGDRGFSQKAANQQQPALPPGKNYALLFASDDYKYWPHLNNPIGDADSIAGELQANYGYDQPAPELVKNATADHIIDVLHTYAEKTYAQNDQLFIYFAGHGFFDPVEQEGFLVGADSRAQKDDSSHSTYLNFSRLSKIIDNIPAAHIFVVLDVCYGGAFDSRVTQYSANRGENDDQYADVAPQKFIARKLAIKRAREYMTSGEITTVPDGKPGQHSPFARRFIEVLRGYGGKKQLLTSLDIAGRVKTVEPEPRFGDFGSSEPGADFLFIPK